MIASSLRLIPRVYSYLYFKSWAKGLWTPRDRRFLRDTILRHYADRSDVRKLLFVGVQSYTQKYERVFKPSVFHTIDPESSVAKYGAALHAVVDLASYREKEFDVVVMNGVIGFGLNEPAHIQSALANVQRISLPGAWLVVGLNSQFWNADIERAFAQIGSFEKWPVTGESRHQFSFPFSRAQHEYRFLRVSNLLRKTSEEQHVAT